MGVYLQQTSLGHEAQGGKGPQGVRQVLAVAGVQGCHSQAGSIRQKVGGWAPGQLGKGPQGESQVLLVELVQDAVHVGGSSSKDFITCKLHVKGSGCHCGAASPVGQGAGA